jgi:DNA polymerase III epsilon subunit-like protein
MFERNILALDLEGDGNVPPAVVEIALIEYAAGAPIRMHRWLVDPGRPITRFATRIHGLTDKDVANAPSLQDIEDDLRALIDGAIIIGHNVGGDVDILRRDIPDLQPEKVFDTLRLAKLVVPEQPSYGLHNLAAELKLQVPEPIEGRGPHSAAFDAALSAELFYFLAKSYGSVFDRKLGQAEVIDEQRDAPRFL